MNHRPKVRAKTTELLEENLCDLDLGKDFLTTMKAQSLKEKN